MVSNTNNLVFYTNKKIYLDYLYLPVYIKNRIEINPLLMLDYFKNFIESEFKIGDVLKGCSLVYIYTSNNEMNSCEVLF